MPQENLYTQILDLGNLDVYLETELNDETYFSVRGLPEKIGFGKHFFTLSYKDPANAPLLATNSSIVFEFVDSNGTVVFSDLADIPDVSGAATGFVWIKEDPLRTENKVFDGELTMNIVGTVSGVPDEWEGRRNLRSSFTFEVRKNQPNVSPIMFVNPHAVEISSSFSESLDADQGRSGFNRGYINVSASHLQTQGGKVSFAELSYQEISSSQSDYTLLNTFELDQGTSSRFEVNPSASQGLNPVSTRFKVPIPRTIRRDTPVRFKLRYLDANKVPAQFFDENKLNQPIVITSSIIDVNGTPIIIEAADNLLRGSMYTGNAVGKGFEQSGRSSAYLKTVDYTGFKSASLGKGSPGVMFFSGSVLTGSGDDYTGVGLELVADSESFFKFRSNPSILDVRAKSFFVGSEATQFISASNGTIEISSSKFHLEPGGDVTFSGSIDASGGRIGGFEISSSRIQSTNRNIIFKANGQISASSLLLASGSFVIDPNNLSRFGTDGFGSFVMAEDTGVKIQTSNFNLNTARFIISSSDVGVIAVGSTPPTEFNVGKGIYMDGDGTFLAGDARGERIQFNGFNLVMSSSAFFLGNEASFMSGSQGKIRISGSDIEIQTPRFFFGDATKFVSGSLGNLEISSSRFHLSRDGNVKLIGRIEAESGFLGGFGITNDAITGSNIVMSGSPEIGGTDDPRFMFISASNFNLKENGDITGSAVSFTGGTIGGFDLSKTQINSTNNDLVLKSNGQITGSNVLFKGGKIAAFNLTDDALSTDSFFISASATDDDLFISASSFNVNAKGIVTASALSLEGGDVGGLVVAEGTISVGEILKLKDSGQVTGSNVLFTGGKIASFELTKDALSTNAFFISASATNNDMFISSSNFNVKASGDITGSKVLLDGGTIGGFELASTQINSTNDRLILKSSGQITASDAQLTGKVTATSGQIAGWKIIGNVLSGSNATLDAAGAALYKSDQGPDTDNSAAFDILRDEYYIDFTPESQGNTKNYYVKFGPNFAVDSTGTLHASGAVFQGTITASAGLIGGFVIGEDRLHDTNNKIALRGSPTAGGGHNAESMFISSSNFNVKQNGDMTGSRVLLSGGKIADFSIDGTKLKQGNSFHLDGASNADYFISSSNFQVTPSGQVTGSSALFDGNIDVTGTGTIASFTLDSSEIRSSNNALRLKSSGEITGSEVLFTGGTIAGFNITANDIFAGNQSISNNNTKIVLGNLDGTPKIALGTNADSISLTAGAGFFVDGDGNFRAGKQKGQGIIFDGTNINLSSSAFRMGSGTNFISGSNGALLIQSSGTTTLSGSGVNILTPKFFLGQKSSAFVSGSNGFVEISSSAFHLDRDGNVTMSGSVNAGEGQIAGFSISGDNLTATNFSLEAANKKISLGTGNTIFIADADDGIQLGHATFSSAPFSVTKAGVIKATSGTIGGFTLSSDRITSNNLIMDSAGVLETADFASGVKGWRISSQGNGEAEFENVTIRGTLSTAVFEKETVNAVGGQLYVANSTALTGSGTISASFTTMSVVNVGGFTGSYGNGAGEILSLKKVTSTGFSTEYVKVQSASRDEPSSDTNFAGKLYVIRGYSGSFNASTGSLGDTPNSAQDYEPGQVIVSTGITGSGYIRLNANPKDSATPFIDIVERTGSAIYDVDLKVRLGDLSGLSSAQVGSRPGFGLFTEKAFLTNEVTVGTLATEHIVIDSTSLVFKDGSTSMAELRGTTWTLGGAHGSTDDAIVLEADSGVKLFDDSDNFAVVNSSGLTVTQSGAGVAKFGSTTTIGNRTTEHVEITSTSLKLKDATTDLIQLSGTTITIGNDSNNKVTITPTSMQIGSTGGGITMDASGNATFNGTITIGSLPSGTVSSSAQVSENLPGGLVSGSAQLADAISGSFGDVSASIATNISSSAADITNNSASAAASLNAVSSSVASDISASSAAITNNSASAAATVTTVSSAASAAQSAIDDMETQVVLDSAGMTLRNASNLNLATFGTTTKFFDGVGHTDDNRKLQLNADGVFAFGPDTGSFVRVFSEGVQLVSHSVERAKFGGTTTIGNTATEHIEITATSLKLKDGGTTRITMDSSGIDIGNDISLDASGNATFSGTITVGSFPAGTVSSSAQLASAISGATVIPDGLVSGSAQLADAISGSFTSFSASAASNISASTAESQTNLNAVSTSIGSDITSLSSSAAADISASAATITNNSASAAAAVTTVSASASTAQAAIDTMETQVVLSSAGMSLRNSSAVDIAQFGTTTKFFDGVDDLEGNMKLRLNTDGVHAFANTTESFARFYSEGVQIVSGGVERAKFAATTTIGNTSTEHVEITDTSLKLKDGSTTRITMDASGMQIGSVANGITLDASGNATFKGSLTIGDFLPAGTISSSTQVSENLPEGTVTSSAQLASAISGATVIPDGLVSGSAQLADAISGSFTSFSASAAGNISASTAQAQTDLNAVSTSVASDISASAADISNNSASVASDLTSISSSVASDISASAATITNNSASAAAAVTTVSASASTAQAAIDTMETQVVLTSAGMSLRNSSAVDIVQFGTTTKFFDGVDDLEGNMKLRLNTDGVHAFANTTESFARFYSEGVQIVSGGVERAKFAATTTIGNTSTEHVEITDTSLKLKDGTTDRITMNSSGVQIGAVNSGITLNSDGDATFKGTLTIGDYLPAGTVSGSSQLASAISGSSGNLSSSVAGEVAGLTAGSSSMATQVVLSTSGMALKNTDGDTLANYGTTTTIGKTDVEHIKLTSSGLELKDGNTTRMSMSSAGIEIGDQFSVDASGNATFGGTLTIGNLVSSSAQLADAISGSSGNLSSSVAGEVAGLTAGSQSMATQVVLSTSGMDLKQADGTTLASYGDAITLGLTSGTENNVFIDNDSVDIRRGTQISASFGSTTTIGPTSGRHVKITGTALEIKTNANTTVLSASAAGLEMQGKVIASSGEIGGFSITPTAISSSNNNIVLKSDGQITLSGSGVDIITPEFFFGSEASFVSGSNGNIEITSSKFHLKPDGDVVVRKINANEGSLAQFTIDNDGLTGNSSAVLTSSIDDTTIRLTSQVANSSGDVFDDGAKQVQRLIRIEAGKVQESMAIHYKGPDDFDDAHATTGLSSAYIGKREDMKEDLGWFQTTYTNYNFANTGKYSFIQIQIDTGSNETYGGSGTPYHGGDHGSTGIHMGTSNDSFNVSQQAPLSSGFLGKGNLSLFANGNISQSLQSSASFGYVEMYGDRYISPYILQFGNDVSTNVEVALALSNTHVDTTSPGSSIEDKAFILPCNAKLMNAAIRAESIPGNSSRINVYECQNGTNAPTLGGSDKIGYFQFDTGAFGSGYTVYGPVGFTEAVTDTSKFVAKGTALMFTFDAGSSAPNDTSFTITLMLDPSTM